MIRYDTPIVKTADEMQPGDIFRTEYGDVGNWCELVLCVVVLALQTVR